MNRNVMNRRPSVVGLVILCLLALVPVAAAQVATDKGAQDAAVSGVALERLIPADTVFYLEVPDVGKAVDGLKQHPLAALYANDEMQAFLNPMLAVLKKQGQQAKEMLGLCPEEILGLMKGRLQLAFVDLAESDKGPQPDFTAAVSFGDRLGDAKEFVARLMEMAKEGGEAEETKLGETQAWRFNDSGLLVFFAHGSLIADTNRARAERILAGKPGEVTSLAKYDGYRTVAAKIGAASAHAHYYVNFKRVIELIRETKPAGELTQDVFEKAMGHLGLKDVHTFGIGMTFGPRGVTERVHMPLPASRAGILKLFDTLKPGLGHPKRLGANTVAYLGKRVDLLAAYDILVDVVGGLVREFSPEEADQMDDYLQKAESGVWGFKLRDDLLASLGEEFGLSMGLRMGSMIPDALFTIEVRDRAKVTSLVEHLRSTLPQDEVTVSRVPVGEHTMLAFKIKDVPVSPAVAILDDTLVAGLFAPTVRRYLRGYRKSLAETDEFQDGLASAGLQDLSGTPVFFFMNVRRIVAYFYDNFGPMLASMDPADMGVEIPGFDQLDFALLPTTEALTRPFKPWVITAKVEPDGFSTTAIGPITMNSLQLLGSLGMFVAVPQRERIVLEEEMIEEAEVVEEEPAPTPTVSLGIGANDLAGGGIEITEVDAGGAAAAAGLKVGDHLTALDGMAIKSVDHALAILAGKKPGDTVTVSVRREKQVITMPVTLKARTPTPAGK